LGVVIACGPERSDRGMIELQEKDEVTPICPRCSQGLAEVWFKELKGFLGRRYVYFCPNCRKVLGVTHRKGLWMG